MVNDGQVIDDGNRPCELFMLVNGSKCPMMSSFECSGHVLDSNKTKKSLNIRDCTCRPF